MQMSQSQTAIEEPGRSPLTTLSEDEQMFRASVREFAEGELRPRVAEMEDKGKLDPAHISMLKRNNVAIALDIARASRDLLGGNGIMEEYPLMRHLCNLETVKTYEGTDHIHTLVIGERVTGVAAYK